MDLEQGTQHQGKKIYWRSRENPSVSTRGCGPKVWLARVFSVLNTQTASPYENPV